MIREYVWLDGRPLAVVEGGQTFWLHWDHIGRPVLATKAAGAVVWAARYLPFGGIDQVSVDTGALAQDLRFPGQWFQAETGLHQNWMRDYDPTTGRYLEADPLGLVDGASVYGYARQSPMVYFDSAGLAGEKNEKYKKPENPNKKKGADERGPKGDRERNVRHPKGEEHSRRPKGGPKVHFCGESCIEEIGVGIAVTGVVCVCVVAPYLCIPASIIGGAGAAASF